MMAVEYGDDIVVVDCGVQFPEEDMPGVDLIIPDVSYLVERADKVRAILITHGHEDHIGALPFILPQLNVPVYAPRLAHGLISVKLNERRPTRGAVLEAIEPGIGYQFGESFRATWFRVCHSIPDAMGIAIETPKGLVIHTGDFKIDHTPVDGRTIDLATLARHGSGGVLLLCSDSTYAEMPGYTQSERVVGEALDRAIADAPGRVMVATFASLISRVQQVVDAAEHSNRKVGIVGRSMESNVAVATEMGYLKIPPGMLQPLSELRQLPPNEVVLLTTGSQGEPRAALSRIAARDHRQVKLGDGDTVIFSSRIIPGNELGIARLHNKLIQNGVDVIMDEHGNVHVSGHPAEDELIEMYQYVRPEIVVPVHGEPRHLKRHAEIAKNCQVPETILVNNGAVVRLAPNKAEIIDQVHAGRFALDGPRIVPLESQAIKDRTRILYNGVAVYTLVLDASGNIIGDPQLTTHGLVEDDEMPDLLSKIFEDVEDEVSKISSSEYDDENELQKIIAIIPALAIK